MKKQYSLYRATKTTYTKIRHCIANELGLTEAYIVEILHGYIELNERNQNSFYYHKGCYWTTISYKGLQEKYKCLGSEKNISRKINSLTKANVLIVDNFNQYKIDKTKWYRINYEVLDLILAEDMEILEPDQPEPLRQNDPWERTNCPIDEDKLSGSIINKLNINKLTNIQEKKQKFVETKKTDLSSSAFCETKKNASKQDSENFEQKTDSCQSEQAGFGVEESLNEVDTQVKTHSLTNQAQCETKKNAAEEEKKKKKPTKRQRNLGNINEYSEMKNQQRQKPQDTNKIDLNTRRHLIDDIRALNASELPIYQKAKLSLLNEHFRAWFDKEYQNVGNPQALLVKEWEVAMLCYLVVLEREEKEKQEQQQQKNEEDSYLDYLNYLSENKLI